jgi:hypothetical protein
MTLHDETRESTMTLNVTFYGICISISYLGRDTEIGKPSCVTTRWSIAVLYLLAWPTLNLLVVVVCARVSEHESQMVVAAVSRYVGR